MPSPTFAHVPGMQQAVPIAQRQAAELNQASFIAEYVARSQPCLIKGAARHWPARQRWRDLDYIKGRSGHHPIYYYPHENHASLARQERDEILMPLGEALDRLTAPETKVGFVCTATPVEVMGDISGFSFLEKVPPAFFYPHIRYFLYRNAGTTWHYHPFDETLMCQVVGAKKVGLLSLDNPRHIALRDIFFREDYYENPACFDHVDPAGLTWFSAEVEEGDALYIPPLWWHGVAPVGEDFGVTAAVPWGSPGNVIASSIQKMAAGQADIIGKATAVHGAELKQVAQRLGLEKEMAIAWERGN